MGPIAEAVVCGAGIAGLAAAHELTVRRGLRNVWIVDERAPLTLTSDKSTECYRNFWPGPGAAMVGLMNRSIDLLDELARESGNRFQLNRRGYLYATGDPVRVPALERFAAEPVSLGAGPLRVHAGAASDPDYVPAPTTGFEGLPTGADLFLDPTLLRRHFPYLAADTVAAIHARRCGWLDAQQLGMYLLERATAAGARHVLGRVTGVRTTGGRVEQVTIETSGGSIAVGTAVFVDAAGPYVAPVARLLGVELPVFSELHLKVAFHDRLGAVPREAPLLIWTDPVRLPWSSDERALLAESPDTAHLLEPFPAGVHARPEGALASDSALLLWTYHTETVEVAFPLSPQPDHAEIALRGMSRMLPALAEYFAHIPRAVVDGGYYTKTRENRLLACRLPVEGAFVLGALSGYGIMAACGAAEILGAHVTGRALPPYAAAFDLARYDDATYRAQLDTWGFTGQL
jgi:glycine/D-amino acid oxidase-like deaminating enzyme